MIARPGAISVRFGKVGRFISQAKRSRAIQERVLLAKIGRNAGSDFGRTHGFDAIASIADFRRRIPVTDYSYYAPYIERVKQGDIQAMFGAGTELLMFAMTSGTTGSPKYLPITREFYREYVAGWNLWGDALYRKYPGLFFKPSLGLVSDWQQSTTASGVPVGNISGLVRQTASWIVRARSVVPPIAAKLAHPQAKHYLALRLSLAAKHIGMIATANPSTLIEFARLADRERATLIKDVHDGTLNSAIEAPTALREQLKPWTSRAKPARARELETIVLRSGHLTPKEAWPDLSVAAIWLGGSAGIYLPRLEEFYGKPVWRDHGLQASEGRMTVPLEDGTSAGVLEYMTHFFEFIPEDEHGRSDPTVLLAHELEAGKRYFILLTTSAGLYRYDIQDVVQCVGYEGEAPILEFINKGSFFANITGEKLSEFQVISAVRAAFAELRLPIDSFTLAPVLGEVLHYVLLLEPGGQMRPETELARKVDAQLQALNCEYAEKRRSGRIGPVQIRQVPSGTWNEMRRRKSAARGNFEEYKHPCLIGDLDAAERIARLTAPELPREPARSPAAVDGP
jgi:hypothetical protein